MNQDTANSTSRVQVSSSFHRTRAFNVPEGHHFMVTGMGRGLHVDDLRQAYNFWNAGKFLVRQIKVHKVDAWTHVGRGALIRELL